MKLRSLTIRGYKSIDQEGQTVTFGDVTVMIGANGSGKSNLLSAFELVNYTTISGLQKYLERKDPERMFHFGTRENHAFSFGFQFENQNTRVGYKAEYRYNPEKENLLVKDSASHQEGGRDNRTEEINFAPESRIRDNSRQGGSLVTYEAAFSCLSGCRAYQFHDTSENAKFRKSGYARDNRYLRSDGGNCAAFLYRMQLEEPAYYERIVRRVSLIFPQFGGFVLEPRGEKEYTRLDWVETESDYTFSPAQLSDGSLRFIALATLLLQPPAWQPCFIVLDEPELGLHPEAISALAGMIRTASANCQLLLATQSPRLVDEFPPEEVVVTERDEKKHRSVFKRLSTSDLSDWLDRYSLSELWEKNVLGGKP